MILKSLVGQGKVCGCDIARQGVAARNGRPLPSSYNATLQYHSCAIYPVALSFLTGARMNTIYIKIIRLLILNSGQLRNLG